MKNWLKIVIKLSLAVILFLAGALLSAMLQCVGGTQLLCGPWYLNSVAYFLMWPYLLPAIMLSSLGKSFLALLLLILSLITNIAWLYLIVEIIHRIIKKIKKKSKSGS